MRALPGVSSHPILASNLSAFLYHHSGVQEPSCITCMSVCLLSAFLCAHVCCSLEEHETSHQHGVYLQKPIFPNLSTLSPVTHLCTALETRYQGYSLITKLQRHIVCSSQVACTGMLASNMHEQWNHQITYICVATSCSFLASSSFHSVCSPHLSSNHTYVT